MSRKSDIYNYILNKNKNECDEYFFTTNEIARKFQMSRAAVSRELNTLVREGMLTKRRGKPVKFSISNNKNSSNSLLNEKSKRDNDGKGVFHDLIGSKGSMEVQVNLAKAAIMYPPNGLHTIILGSTGVGKTTFAQIMYQYGLEIGRFKSGSPFIHFNCSDYSNNPQLLLSVLFGYTKGAFTGAENDKDGVIEQANNGVLFLDEIHRLPPEGQEMLFTIIDTKKYRRLGESGNSQREANILIICATTENIESTLLQTFKRRFPMVLTLPDLKDRSIDERLQLIDYFFCLESKKIDFEIIVNSEVLKYLSSYNCIGNIGQLKNDIQILCAKEFANAMINHTTKLKIKLENNLENNIINEECLNHNFEDAMYFKGKKVTNDKDEKLIIIDKVNDEGLLYKTILEEYSTLLRQGKSIKEIQTKITSFLDNHFSVNIRNDLKDTYRNKGIDKLVSKDILVIVDEIMNEISSDLNIECDPYVSYNLALHIEALVLKIQDSTYSYRPNKILEKASSSRLQKYADKLIKNINQAVNIAIPLEEQDTIELFLETIYRDVSKKPIGVLIIMHGNGVATSLSKMVNNLLGIQHSVGIDMALDESVDDVYYKTLDAVKKVDKGSGVILLVDMGSLTTFAQKIKVDLGIETKVIDNVTSAMAIEVTRKSIFGKTSIEQLVNEILEEANYYKFNRKNSNIFDHSSRRLIRNNDYLFYHSLEQSVNFLNVYSAVELLNSILISMSEKYNIDIIDTLVIKFYFHCLSMIERAIRREQLTFEVSSLEKDKVFVYMENQLNILERTYGIELTDGEILYVTKIIRAFI